MKKQWIFIVLSVWSLLLAAPAKAAVDFVADYDFLQTPHKGNNYDNGQGYVLGVRHDIFGDVKGQPEFAYITDVDFPTTSDVKGSFGELRGYGGIYNFILDLPYNKNVSFNLRAGAGCVWWDFRENPYMQDGDIHVKVDPSIVLKAGIGTDVKIYDKWKLDLNVGWLDTTIGKNVMDPSGASLNLLDADDHINLRYITWRAGIRKEF